MYAGVFFSAAMLKIAEMKYNGANSIFLRILIAKKYALPFRVIDALVSLAHYYLPIIAPAYKHTLFENYGASKRLSNTYPKNKCRILNNN